LIGLGIREKEGRPLAEQLGIDPDRPGSFAFLANGQAYVKSEAVLSIARELRAGSGRGSSNSSHE
jgi:predicted DCC family thiol-disulfide oxidoreductase YuxK